MNITFEQSPNYSAGRNGKKILAIVNHITAGNYPGCKNWLMNPAARASAHYIVTRAGEVIQLVRDEDTAWHAGIVNKPNWSLYDGSNPNRYTLGIEHEGFDGNLTEPQYLATLALHRMLINKWQIPVDSNHIIGHYRIDSVNRPYCPGIKFPWGRLLSNLANDGGVDMKTEIDLPDVKVEMAGVVRTDCCILNIEGRPTAYIPAIALRELGLTVDWDAATRTVKISK